MQNKVKENKGRLKTLPKLKAFLVPPPAKKCPTLDENELLALRGLLEASIKASGQPPHIFASSKGFRLGLQSTVRAINNGKCSCVLISLSIKPPFILRLIAGSVKAKNAAFPVYAQPALESFTEEVFGVKALALALPPLTESLDEKLSKWIEERRKVKPPVEPLPKNITNKKRKRRREVEMPPVPPSPKAITDNKIKRRSEVENAVEPMDVHPPKEASDFLSFSSVAEDVSNLPSRPNDDQEHLMGALGRIAKRAQVAEEAAEETVKQTEAKKDIKAAAHSDVDDFLEDYVPLTVKKTFPNPEKKKKKRRSKTKVKNKKSL